MKVNGNALGVGGPHWLLPKKWFLVFSNVLKKQPKKTCGFSQRKPVRVNVCPWCSHTRRISHSMPWDKFFASGVSFTLWLAGVQLGCPQEQPGPSCQVVSEQFLGEGFTEPAAGHRSNGSPLSRFLCSPGQVQWRHHGLSWSCASTDGLAGSSHSPCVDTGHSPILPGASAYVCEI